MSDEYKSTGVLFSAGLDSAVLFADALQSRGPGERGTRQSPVLALYVSVGFAWEAEERAMAARLFAHPRFAGIGPPVQLSLDMRDVYPPDHWAVRGVPPAFDTADEDVYLHGRNIVLLSKAAIRMGGGTRLLMGQLAGNPFPDATPAFINTMARALSLGLGSPIAIAAPFATLSKADVIRKGIELGVPLELTLSCMQPMDGTHCGRCSKCRERRDAFREAGIEDPAEYRNPPVR